MKVKNNTMNDYLINVLDKGYVKLINHSGNDNTPQETARISTGKEGENYSEEKGIILTRYLMRHKHSTPFEFAHITFELKVPIMVMREFIRHRTLSVNEESGRYKKLDPDYYVPSSSRIKYQSTINNQGSADESVDLDLAVEFIDKCDEINESFEELYSKAVDKGIAKEVSRLSMPISHYTTFRVTGNLLNWYKFLLLRQAENAQWEIRQYANAIFEIIKKLYPNCTQAYEDYWQNAVTFTAKEMDVLLQLIQSDNSVLKGAETKIGPTWTKREFQEFLDKINFVKHE